MANKSNNDETKNARDAKAAKNIGAPQKGSSQPKDNGGKKKSYATILKIGERPS